jgi:hypothetical protein
MMFMVTGLVPLPPDCGDVLFPYAVVVPHSNQPVAGAPLGFTVPFSVADELLTEVAASVVTIGGFTAGAGVAQDKSVPLLVPALFCPTIRKWYVVFAVRFEIVSVT